MHPAAVPTDWLLLALRWSARALGAALVALIVVFVMGEGIAHPPTGPWTVWVQLIAMLITCIALLAAWRWEIPGGAAAVGAMLLFYGVELAGSGRLPGGWVFPTMFLPGLLFVFCGLREAMNRG